MDEQKLSISNFQSGTRSYIDCLYALLTSAGLFHQPKYMLSGMTGMAFKFVIHKRLLPSSLDMYSWQSENWQAVNMLGIYNEAYAGTPMDFTFPLCRKQMLSKIKKSIDEGKAAIGWEIEQSSFCLYTGYQEEEEVLFFRNSGSRESEVLLFDNFGLVSEGNWFVQIIGESIEKDNRDIFRESLSCAVKEWNMGYKVSPDYGAGKEAYRNLLNAFQSQDFSYSGACYFLEKYIDIKSEIGTYMDMVIKEIPELAEAAYLYHKLGATILPLKQIKLTQQFREDIKHIPKASGVFRDAMLIEEKAVKELEKYLCNYINNVSFNPSRLKNLF